MKAYTVTQIFRMYLSTVIKNKTKNLTEFFIVVIGMKKGDLKTEKENMGVFGWYNNSFYCYVSVESFVVKMQTSFVKDLKYVYGRGL